jgi:hypothetical protein
VTTVEMLRTWHFGRPQSDILLCFSVGRDGTSALLDVDGEHAIGRATVWNGGMCDIEAICLSDGRQLLCLHTEVKSQADLDAVVEGLIGAVRDCSPLGCAGKLLSDTK